jgi:regulator of replication initiation timing
MARPSDTEYKLRHQIKELKEQNERLEVENARLKKQLEKTEVKDPNPKKKGKVIAKPCPDCGAETRITDLPHAKMELCSAACGYRNVRNK